ncbi:exodeoxyribonuclease III [Candidatus Gracilibacteria bacterium]|nr:exodeoxyribonuclease III [Candidatus Gracilibacteria bacterium]
MKLISWNVNGIRAVLKKNFIEYLKEENPDVAGFQEIKGNPSQITKKDIAELETLGYHMYWNPASRPGYSGTAVFSKQEALNVIYGIPEASYDTKSIEYVDETLLENHEGRVSCLEFENYFYITVYTPNSKDDLSRLNYRYSVWDKAFLQYLQYLEQSKPVIICGDLNVAHREIDLARPKQNTMSAGFTREEREGMDNFIDGGFIDTFRYKNPDSIDRYSWWSYRAGARARNVGWRIDYFLTSKSIIDKVERAFIRDDVLGSDHCPVGIEISL